MYPFKGDNVKRIFEDSGGNILSRKKMKKLRRYMRRPPKSDIQKSRIREICTNNPCPNPLVSIYFCYLKKITVKVQK